MCVCVKMMLHPITSVKESKGSDLPTAHTRMQTRVACTNGKFQPISFLNFKYHDYGDFAPLALNFKVVPHPGVVLKVIQPLFKHDCIEVA